MKILFITSSSINGGAQKHIRDMFRSLTSMGHNVYIFAPRGWLLDELKEYSAMIYSFEPSKLIIPSLLKVIDQIKPDVTNTFILSGGFIGTLVWKKQKYGKLFVTVNNPVIYDGISLLRKICYPYIYRWMSKYTSAFLVKSDMVRNEVASIIREVKPVISIKNGIDFSFFNKDAYYTSLRDEIGIRANDIVITNVAVLNQRKGQVHLIEAIAALKDKYPIHLILAGEGSYRDSLKVLISRLKVQSNIHLIGRRSDINRVLAASNIFVLSSYHEGLPNSLMEAMAMGLPIITTDVGGVRQLVKEGYSGIIIPAKSTEDIIISIEKYLSDSSLAKLYSQNAYNYLYNNFKQEVVAAELIEIYNKY